MHYRVQRDRQSANIDVLCPWIMTFHDILPMPTSTTLPYCPAPSIGFPTNTAMKRRRSWQTALSLHHVAPSVLLVALSSLHCCSVVGFFSRLMNADGMASQGTHMLIKTTVHVLPFRLNPDAPTRGEFCSIITEL